MSCQNETSLDMYAWKQLTFLSVPKVPPSPHTQNMYKRRQCVDPRLEPHITTKPLINQPPQHIQITINLGPKIPKPRIIHPTKRTIITIQQRIEIERQPIIRRAREAGDAGVVVVGGIELLLVEKGRELVCGAEDVVVVEVVGVVGGREDTDAFVVGVVWVGDAAGDVSSVFLHTVHSNAD